MATSGTVGQTTLDVAQFIEHAFRRCGKVASTVGEEQLQIARDNLYLLLTSLVNRGLNLWTIEKDLIATIEGKAVYTLDPGTVDTLNVFYRTVTLQGFIDYVDDTNSVTYDLTGDPDETVTPVSISFNGDVTGPAVRYYVNTSIDGTYDPYTAFYVTVNRVDGIEAWADFEIAIPCRYVLVQGIGPTGEPVPITFNLDLTRFSTQNIEIDIGRINRDDYTNLPDKNVTGIPTQYWLDRQLTPRMRVWPSTDTSDAVLVVWNQRQVQDVGQLTNTLEIPDRWYEPIIWQLALRLCFEVPGIDSERIKMVVEMAGKYELEVESEEYDNSPVYLAPNINPYTK